MTTANIPKDETVALVRAFEDAQAGESYERTGAVSNSTRDFALLVEHQAEVEGKTVEEVLEQFRQQHLERNRHHRGRHHDRR